MRLLARFRIVLFALICVLCASGPQCNGRAPGRNAPPAKITAGALGVSSAGLPVIPNSGATWSTGSHSKNVPFADVLLDKYINPRRQSMGRPPPIWHDGLTAVSEVHAKDTAKQNYFALVSPQGVSVCNRLVSSVPPMSFAAAYAFPMTTPGNSKQIFDAMLANAVTRGLIDDPTLTHFGGWFVTDPLRRGTVIFGRNVTP
jgi:hypothetical protein